MTDSATCLGGKDIFVNKLTSPSPWFSAMFVNVQSGGASAVSGLFAHHPPPCVKAHTAESEGKNSRFLANLFSMSPTQSSAFTNLS